MAAPILVKIPVSVPVQGPAPILVVMVVPIHAENRVPGPALIHARARVPQPVPARAPERARGRPVHPAVILARSNVTGTVP